MNRFAAAWHLQSRLFCIGAGICAVCGLWMVFMMPTENRDGYMAPHFKIVSPGRHNP